MPAKKRSEAQAFRFESWKSAYLHLGKQAVTLNDLRLQGTTACVIQIIVCTAIPLAFYFLLYKNDSRLVPVPIVIWAVCSLTGCLGIAGFILIKSLILSLHCVAAVVLAAALAMFDSSMFWNINTQCSMSQLAFKGCTTCPCALLSTCTQSQLLNDPLCTSCDAWGVDLCKDATGTASILPYMGLIELVFISMPAVFGFMVLMRMEKEHGDIAVKLQYARSVVQRELVRLEANRGLNVDLVVFKQLLTTVLRHGSRKEKAAAERCCTLLHLEAETLRSAQEWDDGSRNVQMGGDEESGGYGGGHGMAPSFKVGSVTMAHEEYLKKNQGFLNSSFVALAPPGTPQVFQAHDMYESPVQAALERIVDEGKQQELYGTTRRSGNGEVERMDIEHDEYGYDNEYAGMEPPSTAKSKKGTKKKKRRQGGGRASARVAPEDLPGGADGSENGDYYAASEYAATTVGDVESGGRASWEEGDGGGGGAKVSDSAGSQMGGTARPRKSGR